MKAVNEKYFFTSIKCFLNFSNKRLRLNLDQSQFDQFENLAKTIFRRWLTGETNIDESSLRFLDDVAELNFRLVSLIDEFHLDENEIHRIESLVYSSEIHEEILLALLADGQRHNEPIVDQFSRYFYSFFSRGFPSLDKVYRLFEKMFQSEFYEKYFDELCSKKEIQGKHRFFVGTVGRFAATNSNVTLQKRFLGFFNEFYGSASSPVDENRDFCSRGILCQLNATILIDEPSTGSVLRSTFFYAMNNTTIFLPTLMNVLRDFSSKSPTISCALNSDELIETLLKFIVHQNSISSDLNPHLLLGHLISENQLDRYKIGYQLTMKLIDSFSFQIHHRLAILQAIRSLVLHRSIQKIIADTFQLSIFIPFIDEYPIIFDIIYQCSFQPEIVERYATFLENFVKTNENPIVNGIHRNVRKENSVLFQPPTKQFALIYSSFDEQILEPIRTRFLNENISLGSFNDANEIFIFLSEEAKHDCLFQINVRQIFQQNRTPFVCLIREPCRFDDWFRELFTAKTKFFNFTQTTIDSIFSELKLTKPAAVAAPIKSEQTPSKTNLSTWTSIDLGDWCKKQNFQKFLQFFEKIDGKDLLSLGKTDQKNPINSIMAQVRLDSRRLGIKASVTDFNRLQTALEKLIQPSTNRQASTISKRNSTTRKK